MSQSADDQMPHYVYILLCEDGSFYTGITKNLDARMRLHRNGRGAQYTRTHRPEKLVYVEEYESRGEAMRRELKLKKLRHDQKLRMTTRKSNKQKRNLSSFRQKGLKK